MTDLAVVDIRSCALLLIDLQNEYRTDGTYPVEGYCRILHNSAELLAASRTTGMPAYHVQAWVEERDRLAFPFLVAGADDRFRSAVAGSLGAALCDEVQPTPAEPVVRKRWPSALKETSLCTQLHAMGIHSVIAFGVWSDSCVRATVLDAIAAGFHVWLVKDACGSATRAMHRTAVLDMANRLYGGGVLDTARALKAIQGEPYQAWACTRPIEFRYTLDTVDELYEAL